LSKFDEFLLKDYKIIISFLVVLFLATLVYFVFTLINFKKVDKEFKSDNNSQDITLTPSKSEELIITEEEKGEKEWDIGNRESNTEEVIEIKAEKQTEGDIVAIIRMRIVGGEIINKTSQYITLEGCNLSNLNKITNVCIDIAKPTPFEDGEIISSIIIKWDSSSEHKIYRSSEFGYYNGTEFNASNK